MPLVLTQQFPTKMAAIMALRARGVDFLDIDEMVGLPRGQSRQRYFQKSKEAAPTALRFIELSIPHEHFKMLREKGQFRGLSPDNYASMLIMRALDSDAADILTEDAS